MLRDACVDTRHIALFERPSYRISAAACRHWREPQINQAIVLINQFIIDLIQSDTNHAIKLKIKANFEAQSSCRQKSSTRMRFWKPFHLTPQQLWSSKFDEDFRLTLWLKTLKLKTFSLKTLEEHFSAYLSFDPWTIRGPSAVRSTGDRLQIRAGRRFEDQLDKHLPLAQTDLTSLKCLIQIKSIRSL